MGASIEKSLYIGTLKSRFDLFDEVKLKLKNGEIVSGTIEEFEDDCIVYINTEDGAKRVRVDNIDDYVN